MPSIRARKKSSRLRPAGIGASANLVKQLPLIGATFPEIVNAFPGTINLDLEQPLLVQGYDHRTPPLKWENAWGASETFDIVRVELEVGGKRHPAWLYVAHGSPHRRDLSSHEIITPAKIDILDGELCILHIPKAHVSMPYDNFPLIIIN